MLKAVTETEGLNKSRNAEKRACIAKISKQVKCLTNKEGSPTTNRQRRMQKLVARLRELHCQACTVDKQKEEGRSPSEVALKQMQQLWQNITKDAIEEKPYVQWLQGGKWELTQPPTRGTVKKLLHKAVKRAEETEKEAEKERRKAAKDKMNEDMKNGGAAAHTAVKGALGSKKEYVQPTHTIATSEGITSDPQQVHHAFAKEWSEKVFRLQRQKPEWEKFQKEYGRYIPRVPYTQGTINGEDLYKSVQRMGKTVPGLDGWRIHELKLLGLEAWKQRARIVEVQLKVGKVPNSYKQVSTPMMPKIKGTEK